LVRRNNGTDRGGEVPSRRRKRPRYGVLTSGNLAKKKKIKNKTTGGKGIYRGRSKATSVLHMGLRGKPKSPHISIYVH